MFFPRHGYGRNTSLTQQFQNWRELYKYRAHNSLEGIKSKTFTRVEHTYIGVIYCVFTIYMLCSLMHVSYKTEVYFAQHKFTNIVLLVCVSSQNFYIIALKRWIGKVSLLPKYNFVRNRYMIRLFLFTRASFTCSCQPFSEIFQRKTITSGIVILHDKIQKVK